MQHPPAGPYDLPQGYRGYWADPQTFILEYDNVANNNHAMIQVAFEGEDVLMTVQETVPARRSRLVSFGRAATL